MIYHSNCNYSAWGKIMQKGVRNSDWMAIFAKKDKQESSPGLILGRLANFYGFGTTVSKNKKLRSNRS